MIKLVNKAVVVENEVKFNVGDVAQYTTEFFDGRGYNVNTHVGIIVKVNKVTVDIELKNGDVCPFSVIELIRQSISESRGAGFQF